MPKPYPKTLTAEHTDIIRGRQIHAVKLSTLRGLVSFLVPAIVTGLLFYEQWGMIAIAWVLAVLVVFPTRMWMLRRATARGPVPLPARSIRPVIIATIINATLLASFPAWVIVHADGLALAYILSLYLGTYWSASFTLTALFPAAFSFTITHWLVTATVLCIAGVDWERAALIVLFGTGVIAALTITRQQSALFRESVVQELELAKKTETIELLLKEHENQSSDWLWQTDAALRVDQPSSRFLQAMAEQTLAGKTITDLLKHPGIDFNSEALADLEANLIRRRSFRDVVIPLSVGARAVWFSISGRPIYDAKNRFAGYRGVMADITDTRLAQARAAHLAQHDALTDLPNRANFSTLLRRSLARGRAFSLLSIDLDGFKAINDNFGHTVGDATLVEIARRLQENVGSKDVVARLGDDEFIIQIWSLEIEQIETLCRQLIDAACRPMLVDEQTVVVGASIGVALAPADGATSAEILKSADAALYRAKNDGRGTFRFFSPALDSELQLRQQVIQELRTALTRDELVLHYQPVFDAQNGAITGAEALIRWPHSERGMISPAEFIPLAEESGLILALGNWVIEQACREAASWQNERRISINVSPRQFSDTDLHTRIVTVLEQTGLAPSRLEIEVTETVFIKEPQVALDMLCRLRALGVRVALDDFGTGYSSLSYLRLFPFDRIKIDRAFVQDIGQRQDDQVIVHAIVDIATGLGMKITAEGIESREQADYLADIGCHELQGFLFARPAPAGETLRAADRHTRPLTQLAMQQTLFNP
ncbi:PAS/PAC sensor-containing diguanylate cyclase/phosphodiesterase [Salinisphaera sp. C84B14]|uniref:putative bifunctional diguanylate cyclase/phosphodiesterase n=1 Tax=Salinisphaera sp. C84B14 TaxID=1304155 RepID=UPI00334040AE